ncbi:MAG TPA: T9SS type A sorting domain-containing protein, partial [Cytophagales bacterium]
TMQFTLPVTNAAFSLTSTGGTDAFLLKYNFNGGFAFGRQLGGAGADFGAAVAHDGNRGNIYLTGGYAPASNPLLSDVLVARYNAAGTLLAQKTYGTSAHPDAGNDIVADRNDVFVTGYFGGTTPFDAMTATSKGGADAFVVRFSDDAPLSATWLKQFGGPAWDEGQRLAYRSGKLYVSGSFRGTASFGATTLRAKGGDSDSDLFLAGMAGDGTPGWVKRLGSTSPDYGRGGIALPHDNTIFLTGHYGGSVTLGNTTLGGPGNLLTRINLPAIKDLLLIDAGTDQVIRTLTTNAGTINYPGSINYLAIGTNKINLRVDGLAGTVGSVKFTFDGVTRMENAAPFTWAGDALKPDGSTDYLGFTPSLGSHMLEVTAYAAPNGGGAAGLTQRFGFNITSQFELMDLRLINADTDEDLRSLLDGIFSGNGQRVNVRAVTAPAKVGSVQFILDGVTRVENLAPYTLAGDGLKPDGSIDYKPVTFSPGFHLLKVTAYTGANATGTASNTISKWFLVEADGSRVAAGQPGPEGEFARLTVAPNPFAGRTTLSFTAAEDGPARVEVYNSQGMRVARLYEGTLEKGKAYRWAFDGTVHPAGLYFARLKAGNRVF